MGESFDRLVDEVVWGQGAWLGIMEAVASRMNATGGQLVGFGPQATVPFNWFSGLPEEAISGFAEVGGGDIRVNSRVRIGSAIPELVVRHEAHFSTAQDSARHKEYGAFLKRWDIGQACLTPLLKREDMLIGLAASRRYRDEPYSNEDVRRFTELATTIRRGVKTQLRLQDRAFEMATVGLDAVGSTVIVCDPALRVLRLSPRAEAFVGTGRWLTVQNGRLVPALAADERQLQAVVGAALAPEAALSSAALNGVVVRDRDGAPLLVEAFALPPDNAYRFSSPVLLVMRPASGTEVRAAEAARLLYGATAAEALVAGMLAGGRSPPEIAELTGTALSTVRTHVRRLLLKSGARNQVELVARICEQI